MLLFSRVNRRLVFGLAGGFLALAFYLMLGTGSASAHPGHDHALYTDSGPCGPGMYQVGDLGLCTHGPDPAPPGVTASEIDPPVEFAAAADAVCDGDGVSGNRVQVLYVRATDQADRYSSYVASFRTWAVQADSIYQASAAETGGERYIRFVHDSACTISVQKVTVGTADDDSFNALINALYYGGYGQNNRKYLVFLENTDPYACGVGGTYTDDSFGQTNDNNLLTSWAIVYSGCWADSTTAAHELGHALGAVQETAPNYSGYGHCVDEWDIMCYPDGTSLPMRYLCGDYSHDARLDCNHDDYFHTNPPAGNYLATHWNVANSRFLGREMPSLARLTLDKEKSKYNGWVTASVTGFAPNTAINVRWPGGTLLVSFTTDATGAGSGRFRTPLEPLGDYTIRAIGGGDSATATLRIIPRIMLAPEDDGPTGFRFRVYFYGFSPGERVQVQWYTVAGTSYDVLATVTIADTGRGSTILYVPDNAPVGKHMLRGKVIGVSRSASTYFTVTAPTIAEEPTATPSSTATATPAPTETPIPDASPVIEETPTVPPTEEPAPTETPTPEPMVDPGTPEPGIETPTQEAAEPTP